MKTGRWSRAATLTRTAGGLALAAALAGCGGDAPRDGAEREAAPPARLLVYSGRNEALVGPLFERFGERTGIEVAARYGDTAELAATLFEEGENSPADLFLSQDAAALGALSADGRLAPLPADLVERVAPAFRSPADDWVGLSGRARVVVYNSDRIAPGELPQSLDEATDPRYRGRFGLAPTNGSFQAHLAVYRALAGRAALEALAGGLAANEPLRYPKNSSIVDATLAGEIDWGLVNHYYLWRALKESPEAPGANFFMPEGPAGTFINVAGIAVLRDTEAARRLVGFLLSEEAQRYFADETFEYPLAAGVEPGAGLPPLAELDTPEIDFARVSEVLEETLQAISDSGLVE